MPLLGIGFAFVTGCIGQLNRHKQETLPNIVLIFLDDAGWSDFEPFWSTRYPTPNVAKLAKEGMTFHNFYVPQAACTPSRAALLTGSYPERVGALEVFEPREYGLDPQYVTIAEILRSAGYKTAHFGKWHLGDHPETRPPARGFDESSGIMYSNDMWAAHPTDPEYWGQHPLQYWAHDHIRIDSVTTEHQKQFTTWITEDAVDFIIRNHKYPFFLYVPHPMPHVPLFVSEKFKGKSGTGKYGDVIMELDWSLGQIMNALEENEVDDNTILLFTSDNGPWSLYGNHAGKTPFRGEKGTSFDGGVRMPMIIRYPGHFEPGSNSHRTFFSIDILPTLAHHTAASLPEHEIDGQNVWEWISGAEDVENPHDYYAVTMARNLDAVLSPDGKWKLHLPHEYRKTVRGGRDGEAGLYGRGETGMALYDMVHDPYEKVNVIDLYPDITRELLEHARYHYNLFKSDISARIEDPLLE